MIITDELGTPKLNTVHCCDALKLLGNMAAGSVNCVVTSPPYFNLRDYSAPGQIGLEETPAAYVAKLVELFHEVKRVLRDDGVFWLNLGDTYTGGGRGNNQPIGAPEWKQGTNAGSVIDYRTDVDGLASKNLIGIPWRVAFGLQDDGWILRSEIIWHKPSCMPESVTDRPTKSHETIFLFAKSQRYWYDADAISEPSLYAGATVKTNGADGMTYGYDGNRTREGLKRGVIVDERRNKRTVWTVNTEPFKGWIQTVRRVDVALGDVSDGTKRIASLNCPIHGLTDHPGSTYVCDAHEADVLNHSLDIALHLSQERFSGSAPIDPNGALGLPEQNSDLRQGEHSHSATRHNTENYKTARAPVTNQPCMPSDQNLSGIGDTSNGHEYAEQHHDMHENNTLQDEPGARLPDQKSDHIVDTFSSETPLVCLCSFYNETTEKTSHFATFPQKLIEPMILAGCPDKVCCKCGATWVRDVERETNWQERVENGAGSGSLTNGHNTSHGKGMSHDLGGGRIVDKGFKPTCACNADTRPGVVYDPFMGSGTTALVARRLGRNYIGSELNPEYVAIARERLRLPFEERYVKADDAPLTDLPLFAQKPA